MAPKLVYRNRKYGSYVKMASSLVNRSKKYGRYVQRPKNLYLHEQKVRHVIIFYLYRKSCPTSLQDDSILTSSTTQLSRELKTSSLNFTKVQWTWCYIQGVH